MLHTLLHDAKKAAEQLYTATSEQKDAALKAVEELIAARIPLILAANMQDMDAAKAAQKPAAFLDRLELTKERLHGIIASLASIRAQTDPVGVVLEQWTRPNGLSFKKIRVPLGVVGIIFEARPNVTADAGALCIKSGNAAVLRCGRESFESSRALAACFADGLEVAGLLRGAVQLVPTTDRAAVTEMLHAFGMIDVIIPRGGRSLIESVLQETRIPVLKHLDGICHLYVDKAADASKALSLTINAKLRRTGICGALETLLVHRDVIETHLVPILNALDEKGCEVRGDALVKALSSKVVLADEEDWHKEYLAPILAVKTVESLDEAIQHINTYGSHHTDSIVTEDAEAASRFTAEVDSGIVMVNTSTQFADGGEFGFGAEIGISTDKLHARGPVGAQHLTSTKYIVESVCGLRQ